MLAGFELTPTVPLVGSESPACAPARRGARRPYGTKEGSAREDEPAEITIIRRGQLTSAGAIIEPVREGQQMLVNRGQQNESAAAADVVTASATVDPQTAFLEGE